MTNIRLLPVVILSISALLVLKTFGLVTGGGYVLSGVSVAQAAGGGSGASDATVTLPSEPTIEDSTPTLSDGTPTMGQAPASAERGATGSEGGAAAGDHSAPASAAPVAVAAASANLVAEENACDPRPVAAQGETPSEDGALLVIPAECPPLRDALPQLLTPDGSTPLAADSLLTEQVLLERLGDRRSELDTYAQELAMRASLVEAAEKRIAERQQTLEAIEGQISSLVEQRKAMEEGQFASIVAMYETMKPKDAANIFNVLDIEVLLKVAKLMSPRKMAPILAEMDTNRAQELTVRMASASVDPLDQMAPEDIAALPQIVGQ